MNSTYRKDIMINGSPTVEIDYKGMHVAILALEQGVLKGNDYDWYTLDEIVIGGLTKAEQRKLRSKSASEADWLSAVGLTSTAVKGELPL